MTDQATMTCVHASNLLKEAAFAKGKTYQAYRENGKVFVKCEIGMSIQVNLGAGIDNRSAWVSDTEMGTYHFKKN